MQLLLDLQKLYVYFPIIEPTTITVILFMKCRYLDEITGGRGVVFATGTPISNSMVELYTIQRYLQYRTLQEHDLQHFDAWASMFGETVTAVELTPEGTGYRAKTRFAKFNLPAGCGTG